MSKINKRKGEHFELYSEVKLFANPPKTKCIRSDITAS